MRFCINVIMRWAVGFAALFAISALLASSQSYAQMPPQNGSDRAALISELKSGGAVLLLRHAQTVPGTGDPPGYALSDCSTQRNLSPEGVMDAKRTAEVIARERIVFTKIYSSQWCRCRDTANAFASASRASLDWPALNSFFDNASTSTKQSEDVRKRLNTLRANESWLLVTHQVNITALTGVTPAMGEGVVVRAVGGQWRVLGRLRL